VVASPSIVVDNGAASATVTVTLEDAYTNVISGKSITLGQGSTSSVISPNPVVTGSNGVSTFNVTDTNREIVTYTAHDTTDSVVLAATAQVSFATQLTPPTAVTLSYGTTPGSLGVSFTAPTNAPAGQTYTALACLDAGMSTNCVGPAPITSGGQIAGLTAAQGSAGVSYYVTITATASTGYLVSTSAVTSPHAATSQVNAPTNLTVVPSTTTAGALTATFTASSGTAPSSYTAYACTSPGMTSGCITPEVITSGGQITGLTAGAGYYVAITANPPTGYVSASSAVVGPAVSTQTLNVATNVTLSYGTTPGSIGVSFTAPTNAPGGQTYTAVACTGTGMTGTCTSPAAITSVGQITGLTAVQGSVGTSYYVEITATASTGYLASTSTQAGPQAAMSQVNAPTNVTVTPSTTTAGAVIITFANSTGTTPTSYSATVCNGAGMTGTCTTHTTYTSGSQITGLIAGTGYYVTVTAVPPTGYISATSSIIGPTSATVQLNAPTSVSLAAGTTAGSVIVNFTGSSNAPGGQLYTAYACTGTGMTGTCTSPAAITSGGQITGLTGGTNYYVTVSASSSTGYLASIASNVAGPFAATAQLAVATNVTLSYGTTPGSIGVSFTAPTNAPGGQTYTAVACTGTGMTGTCTSPAAITSVGQITGLTAVQGSVGTSYYVEITATASTGYLASTSTQAGPQAAMSQVNAPTNVTVTPSTTTAGAVIITFANSTGTTPTSYSAQICTGSGTGCGTGQTITSGAQIGSLAQGTSYYVTITANAPTGYLPASVNGGPGMATIGMTGPTSVALSYGTTSGSLTVTFTAPPTHASAQSYTAIACTGSGMTGTCTSPAAITTGGQITGLTATQGSAGINYYATVTATASTGYLASTSTVAAPQADTSQVYPPTGFSTASSTTTAGAITATFTASTGVAPASYTAIACTGSGMTGTCTSPAAITTGGQITGLTAGTNYYVTITAVPPSSAYVSATTAVSAATLATTQLGAPSITSLAAGTNTASGSLVVNFTGSSGAPGGQTYTAIACTGSGMTGTCTSPAAITTGGQITGLAAGTSYYVTVTATASTGYLVSTSAQAGSSVATEQLNAPAITALATSGSNALTVTFSAPSNAPVGQLYSARACTGTGMTGTCFIQSTITSGGQFTGLATSTAYFVTVMAVASTGYTSSTSAQFGSQTS
jgi:hypothetical protein